MTDDYPYPVETYILIGKISEPQGLKGEVKIFSFAGQPENIEGYKKVVLVSPAGKLSPSYAVEKCRIKGKFAIVLLASVNDRNGAEAISGMGVLIRKEDLPQLNEDEFYLYQMEGLPVITTDGRRLGIVTSISSNGVQDLLVVQDADNEYLIPILDTIVIHHDAEKIVIEPPPGLLEINSGDSTD
jgi:16S rRNA processing protein RimM